MDTRYDGVETTTFRIDFGMVLIFLLVIGALLVALISYGKTTTQGWEAAEVRNCINNNPNMIVQVDRNLFHRYCEMDDGVGLQVLERDEKGQYYELRARIEHSLRNFNTVKINVYKNGWSILSKLP